MNYTFEKLRDIIECFDPCMDIICMCMISFRIYTLYRKGHRKDLHFRLIVLQNAVEEQPQICIFRGL